MINSKGPNPDPKFRIADPDPEGQLITDPPDPDPQHGQKFTEHEVVSQGRSEKC